MVNGVHGGDGRNAARHVMEVSRRECVLADDRSLAAVAAREILRSAKSATYNFVEVRFIVLFQFPIFYLF